MRRYREATSKHAGLPTRRLLALHAQGECLGLAPEPPALGRNVPVVAVVSLALDVHAPPLLVRALPQPLVHLLVLEAGRSLLGLLQRLKPLARRVDPVGLPQPRRRLELLRDLACKMARARALCTWVRMLRVPHVLCIHNYAPAVSRSAKSGSAKILSSGRSSASGRRGPFPMPWPRMAACTLTPSAGPAIARAALGGDNCRISAENELGLVQTLFLGLPRVRPWHARRAWKPLSWRRVAHGGQVRERAQLVLPAGSKSVCHGALALLPRLLG